MYATDPEYFARIAAFNRRPSYAAEVDRLRLALDLPEGARLLDVGCGLGATLAVLGGSWNVVGIDRADAWRSSVRTAAATCDTACRQRLAQADAHALPFTNGSFDGVYLMHSLAHLTSPRDALGELRRVLRSAGRLAIVTPNRRFLTAVGLWSRLVGYRPDPTVERHLTVTEVAALLRAAGFRVERSTTLGRGPFRLPLDSLRERLLVVATRAD